MSRLAPALLTLLVAGPALAHDRYEHHSHYTAPYGKVEVYNGSGGRVTVSLPGQTSRILDPYRVAVFDAPAGEAVVRATYVQFGADRVLETERVYIQPGRTSRISLEPEHLARVRIVNKSPVSATLLVNGVTKALLTPGEVRVATLPVGSADLQLLGAGRVLGQTHLELRPFAEPAWCVEVPAVGDLVVTNPLPIPILVSAGPSVPVTLAPYGRTTLRELPAGSLTVTARRVSGQSVDTERVEIVTFGTSAWSVDAPRTGLVTVDSDLPVPTDILLDGRRVTSLSPEGIGTLETGLGWHQVEARDPYGRVVFAGWVESEPFEVNKVEFGEKRHERAYGERADRDQGYETRNADYREDRHDGDTVAEGDEHCHMR